MIASQLTYGAVNYMDSVTFCGQTCHTVMQPEYTAYQNSPHSHVECVKCHIGPGASWFVQSKLSGRGPGVRGHLQHLPAADPDARSTTCARRARPAKPATGRRSTARTASQVISKYADDETNTQTKTVLLMKIGGGNGGIGIHGTHLGPGQSTFATATPTKRARPFPGWNTTTTAARRSMPRPDAKPDGAGLTMREMDCMDCHNRPSHTFDLPERALDRAMNAGLISPALPFAKKKALEILKVNYASRDEAAAARFPRRSRSSTRRATRPSGRRAQAEVIGIGQGGAGYLRPQHLPRHEGHLGQVSDQHRPHRFSRLLPLPRRRPQRRQDGKSITQDCNACHNLLAMDEKNPKVLTDLGITQARAPEAR